MFPLGSGSPTLRIRLLITYSPTHHGSHICRSHSFLPPGIADRSPSASNPCRVLCMPIPGTLCVPWLANIKLFFHIARKKAGYYQKTVQISRARACAHALTPSCADSWAASWGNGTSNCPTFQCSLGYPRIRAQTPCRVDPWGKPTCRSQTFRRSLGYPHRPQISRASPGQPPR